MRCKKIRYPSEITAMLAISDQADKDPAPIRCYRCEKCKGWHLTSRPLYLNAIGKGAPVPRKGTVRPESTWEVEP